MASTRFLLAFLCLFPGLAAAAETALQAASQLLRQGQYAQAMTKVNGHLADNPRDAQGRFLKGLILAEQNRVPEAIRVFTELTTDYPELPEPYNNLAVLYAAQGQYERAKQSLELAIRTHPSYATAHENLGDIYAKMASAAYDKALQLDKSNTSAQTKLALIKDLFSPAGIDRAKPKAPGDKPAIVSQAAPAARNPPPPATSTVDAPRPASTLKNSPGDVAAAASKAQVEKALRDWAAAWSSKDVAAYLAFYAPDFTPAAGLDRAQWEALRKARIEKPEHIRVDISQLQISLDGNKADASFRQDYVSNLLRNVARKTLTLENQGGTWKIVAEN